MTRNDDLFYEIALTQVPSIGAVLARNLLTHFETAKQVFDAKAKQLEAVENVGPSHYKALKQFDNFKRVEQEMLFIEKYNIEAISLKNPKYPKRLLNCYDPPTVLYYKGTASLNHEKIVAIVGTRSNSDYGKEVTEQLIEGLAAQNVLVLSGLAFGIDVIAHKKALKAQLPTVAVVAHGLDKVYPPEHTKIAKDMIAQNGGLLTEFLSETRPNKHNFPTRNRIVAGLCDACIVIETDVKGGSMITAELANGYNKDVFAYPGKVTDAKSSGCNHLIQNNKALLCTSANDVINFMQWMPATKPKKVQRELFVQLTPQEQTIVDVLKQKEAVHIDEISAKTQFTLGAIATNLLTLEMQGIVLSLPGKLYKLS
jgi:DNA processing protein